MPRASAREPPSEFRCRVVEPAATPEPESTPYALICAVYSRRIDCPRRERPTDVMNSIAALLQAAEYLERRDRGNRRQLSRVHLAGGRV